MTFSRYYLTSERKGSTVGTASPIDATQLTRLACEVYQAGISTHATAAAMEARHAMATGQWTWHNPRTGSRLAVAAA